MAKKLYYNLEGRAFNVTTGTGEPNIAIPGTPKVWLDEEFASQFPVFFKEVELEKKVDLKTKINKEIEYEYEYDEYGNIDLEIDFDEKLGDIEIEFYPEKK